MRRFLVLFLWAGLLFQTGWTQTSAPATLTVRWYGHGFIYIISTTGVRVAINPFGPELVEYKFPPKLQADAVLISHEAEDSAAGDKLFGTPQIFRSNTAVGLNKARGYFFKGVQTFRDNQHGALLGSNTAFSFTIDGIRFAHLGAIAHPLDSAQRRLLGPVDVLFLPVGNPQVSIEELRRICADLAPKIIVPIAYKTIFTPKLELRKLDDFLEGGPEHKQLETSDFSLSPTTLPAKQMIILPKLPIDQAS